MYDTIIHDWEYMEQFMRDVEAAKAADTENLQK